jgi:hypothetical protein
MAGTDDGAVAWRRIAVRRVSRRSAFGLGLVAGQWADGAVHTGFLCTLAGVFVRLVVGSASVVALYRATLRSIEREWRVESTRTDSPTAR